MPEHPPHADDQPELPPAREPKASADNPGVENPVRAIMQSESLMMALSESESRVYMSPLPSPADLERMERLKPGAFERLLTMAEQNAKTARENETKLVDASIADRQAARRESSRGQIFGLIVTVLAFALAGASMFLGHPVSAIFLGLAPLAVLVGVFVVGKSRRNELTKDDGTVDDG